MKTKHLTIMLLFLGFFLQTSYSQHKTIFVIEDLKPAKELHRLLPSENAFQEMIAKDYGYPSSLYATKHLGLTLPYNILTMSELPDSLVIAFGYHPFFNGMYSAYANYRPFVLSPDMMWLLVSQGFTRHVNANAEKLRNKFVNSKGKLDLIVDGKRVRLDDSNADWKSVFNEFNSQIGNKVGKEMVDVLTCNFSTTTSIEKIASQITVMEAVKPYFEYIVMSIVCGIPEITLEGTPDDWRKVLNKAQQLRKYELNWWIDEIEPLLKEFVAASEGNVDKQFWRNMFKYHTKKKYGAPNVIDGWIVKFFPYNNKGQRNNLDSIVKTDELPAEIVKVDLKYIETDGKNQNVIPLELWAGFVGLEQNRTTMALRPKIGWMIRKKTEMKEETINKMKKLSEEEWGGLQIRVDKVPEDLLKLEYVKKLEVQFIKDIFIPEQMGKIKIDEMRLSGNISKKEKEKIIKMFPETALTINGKNYNYEMKTNSATEDGFLTFKKMKVKIK